MKNSAIFKGALLLLIWHGGYAMEASPHLGGAGQTLEGDKEASKDGQEDVDYFVEEEGKFYLSKNIKSFADTLSAAPIFRDPDQGYLLDSLKKLISLGIFENAVLVKRFCHIMDQSVESDMVSYLSLDWRQKLLLALCKVKDLVLQYACRNIFLDTKGREAFNKLSQNLAQKNTPFDKANNEEIKRSEDFIKKIDQYFKSLKSLKKEAEKKINHTFQLADLSNEDKKQKLSRIFLKLCQEGAFEDEQNVREMFDFVDVLARSHPYLKNWREDFLYAMLNQDSLEKVKSHIAIFYDGEIIEAGKKLYQNFIQKKPPFESLNEDQRKVMEEKFNHMTYFINDYLSFSEKTPERNFDEEEYKKYKMREEEKGGQVFEHLQDSEEEQNPQKLLADILKNPDQYFQFFERMKEINAFSIFQFIRHFFSLTQDPEQSVQLARILQKVFDRECCQAQDQVAQRKTPFFKGDTFYYENVHAYIMSQLFTYCNENEVAQYFLGLDYQNEYLEKDTKYFILKRFIFQTMRDHESLAWIREHANEERVFEALRKIDRVYDPKDLDDLYASESLKASKDLKELENLSFLGKGFNLRAFESLHALKNVYVLGYLDFLRATINVKKSFSKIISSVNKKSSEIVNGSDCVFPLCELNMGSFFEGIKVEGVKKMKEEETRIQDQKREEERKQKKKEERAMLKEMEEKPSAEEEKERGSPMPQKKEESLLLWGAKDRTLAIFQGEESNSDNDSDDSLGDKYAVDATSEAVVTSAELAREKEEVEEREVLRKGKELKKRLKRGREKALDFEYKTKKETMARKGASFAYSRDKSSFSLDSETSSSESSSDSHRSSSPVFIEDSRRSREEPRSDLGKVKKVEAEVFALMQMREKIKEDENKIKNLKNYSAALEENNATREIKIEEMKEFAKEFAKSLENKRLALTDFSENRQERIKSLQNTPAALEANKGELENHTVALRGAANSSEDLMLSLRTLGERNDEENIRINIINQNIVGSIRYINENKKFINQYKKEIKYFDYLKNELEDDGVREMKVSEVFKTLSLPELGELFARQIRRMGKEEKEKQRNKKGLKFKKAVEYDTLKFLSALLNRMENEPGAEKNIREKVTFLVLCSLAKNAQEGMDHLSDFSTFFKTGQAPLDFIKEFLNPSSVLIDWDRLGYLDYSDFIRHISVDLLPEEVAEIIKEGLHKASEENGEKYERNIGKIFNFLKNFAQIKKGGNPLIEEGELYKFFIDSFLKNNPLEEGEMGDRHGEVLRCPLMAITNEGVQECFAREKEAEKKGADASMEMIETGVQSREKSDEGNNDGERHRLSWDVYQSALKDAHLNDEQILTLQKKTLADFLRRGKNRHVNFLRDMIKKEDRLSEMIEREYPLLETAAREEVAHEDVAEEEREVPAYGEKEAIDQNLGSHVSANMDSPQAEDDDFMDASNFMDARKDADQWRNFSPSLMALINELVQECSMAMREKEAEKKGVDASMEMIETGVSSEEALVLDDKFFEKCLLKWGDYENFLRKNKFKDQDIRRLQNGVMECFCQKEQSNHLMILGKICEQENTLEEKAAKDQWKGGEVDEDQ